MSRFKKASRASLPIKLELFGPPGSGKTWSSLLLAKGMGSKNIFLLDSEQSAGLYSDLADFQIADLNPGDYEKQQRKFIKDFCDTFAEAVDAGADCIIIDSLTHMWDAVKDYVTSLGGKYTDWNKGTPLWNRIMKMILTCPVPVIICSRASYDDVIEMTEKNGKPSYQVKRLGTKADVRKNTDYEFTTVLSVDYVGKFKATKDRTGLFSETMGEAGEPRMLDESIGKEIRDWMDDGDMQVEEFERVDLEENTSKAQKALEKAKEEPEPKPEKKKTVKKEAKPEWAKTTNAYLDAIDDSTELEEINELGRSIEDFIKETKDLPEDAATTLRQAIIDKTKEVEIPY